LCQSYRRKYKIRGILHKNDDLDGRNVEKTSLTKLGNVPSPTNIAQTRHPTYWRMVKPRGSEELDKTASEKEKWTKYKITQSSRNWESPAKKWTQKREKGKKRNNESTHNQARNTEENRWAPNVHDKRAVSFGAEGRKAGGRERESVCVCVCRITR